MPTVTWSPGHQGASERAGEGYDAAALAEDAAALLDALGHGAAAVVAIDAGVAPAVLLALREPRRVTHLVVMEGLAGRLPGAEAFVAGGPQWWFGFHAVPDLAETVLLGNEAAYVDWFLQTGTAAGHTVAPEVRDAFVTAHTGREALRCGFSLYRALPQGAAQLAEAAEARRLSAPTLAIAGGVVGTALHGQLTPIADRLSGESIPECGHLIPLERPADLAARIRAFVGPDRVTCR